MKNASDNHRGDGNLHNAGEGTDVSEVKAWFVREVLPLEGTLQFLRKSSSSNADAEDICQEVYMRIFASARKEIPNPTKPLLFKVARDLLVDRARRRRRNPPFLLFNGRQTIRRARAGKSSCRALQPRHLFRRIDLTAFILLARDLYFWLAHCEGLN